MKGIAMDQERIKGTGKQVSRAITEAVGKVTGDTKTPAEVTAEKAERRCRCQRRGARHA